MSGSNKSAADSPRLDIDKSLLKIGRFINVLKRDAADSITFPDQHVSNSLHKDTGGKLFFKTFPLCDKALLSGNDLFLIIDDCNVRHIIPVNIDFRGSKLALTIKKGPVLKEIERAKTVFLAIAGSAYDLAAAPERLLIGMSVFFNDQAIATVIDVFNNQAHDVLVVETGDGKEILLPDVAEYLLKKDFANKRIVFKNIQDFLDL